MAMFVHQCCSQVVHLRALLTSCKSTCFFYHVFFRMLDTPFNQLPRDGPFTKMSCLPLCLRDATKQGARCPPATLDIWKENSLKQMSFPESFWKSWGKMNSLVVFAFTMGRVIAMLGETYFVLIACQ